ncbi:hypothetical protein ACQV5M_22335, partial [Leptospira sp. SA-E8]|uniref:hypothetical protein n=1 Tax=Leptospira sp. SA-E8 TaxID=3422259 RepID=UPI003EB6A667
MGINIPVILPINDQDSNVRSVDNTRPGGDGSVTTISATRLADQLSSIKINPEVLRERVRQAGVTGQTVTPRINGGTPAIEATAASASLMWRKQALDRGVPADN